MGEISFQQGVRDRLKHYAREVTKCVSNLFECTQDPKDHRIVANAIITMYDQVGRWYTPTSKEADDHLVATYWALTNRMLGVDLR